MFYAILYCTDDIALQLCRRILLLITKLCTAHKPTALCESLDLPEHKLPLQDVSRYVGY